jgi:hypothetical protein
MSSHTFQFTTDEFERLIWDAGIDTHTKTVALAIRFHMNHKTRSCNPSIPRLAKMCRCDERTVRRCVKDIERVLGIKITAAEGKSHQFELQVFNTADAIVRMLEQPEWKQSYWLLFTRDALEGIVSGFRDALAAKDAQPPSSDVPRTSKNLYKNSYTVDAAANGAVNGKAHHSKRQRLKRAPAISYTLDFEEFWQAYRDLMERAGGAARKNRNNMPKPETYAAWFALDDNDRRLARDVLEDFAREAGEWMVYASRYLSQGIFRNYAEEITRKRERDLTLVAEFFMRKREWTENMVDALGHPPGHPECRLTPDLIKTARALAELGEKGAAGHA